MGFAYVADLDLAGFGGLTALLAAGIAATRPAPTAARIALACAGLSTLSSGSLALWFASNGFTQVDAGTLQMMVAGHGLVNAIGFVGLGLVGLRLLRP